MVKYNCFYPVKAAIIYKGVNFKANEDQKVPTFMEMLLQWNDARIMPKKRAMVTDKNGERHVIK